MSKVHLKKWAVVPAAGSGSRFDSQKQKQYHRLGNKTVIEYALAPLLAHPNIEKVVVVLSAEDHQWPQLSCASHPKILTAVGGKERSYSVLNGLLTLKNLAQKEDWVLVHDAVRPCLKETDLEKLLKTLNTHSVGGLLAIPACDTIKEMDARSAQLKTLNRNHLWHAMTPQMFRYDLLCQALSLAHASGKQVTDEAQAIEFLGRQPLIVEGSANNIKITRSEDLALAEFFINQREESVCV